MHCRIYSIAAFTRHGYVWEWSSRNGQKSERSFDLFYECLEDARLHGFDPDLEQIICTHGPHARFPIARSGNKHHRAL